ncbi:DUF5711 family protein [Ruminococcus sp.]|uniref:DUF5711 family protein n=1 Tax=Ruminococcus sp. TaxID=41978 RepID=UPI0038685105
MFNKRNGRYAETKPNKERTVISYEDMPLEDYEQERTNISPKAVKKIIIAVAIALVAGLLVLAFANRDKLSPENLSMWWSYEVLGNGGKGYPVELVGSEVKKGNFAVNQSRVAYASDTSFVTLNSSSKEIANVQLRYSKPVMKSGENRFLTYGLGDTGYQILTYDKELYAGTAEGVIFTGDIAPNGNFCLVTEGNGFLSELYAFDRNNNRIYKYSFSEYYINSVAINSDGSGCVACGITSNNGAMRTGIYVLDFSKEEPVGKYTIENDSILDSRYISGRRIALVGENASYVVKVGEEDYASVKYEGKLTNYCFSPSTRSYAIALSKSGDGRSCTLIRYNDNGDVQTQIDTEKGAESFSVFKGTMAVLDGNTIYTFNSEGNITNTCDAGTGATAVTLTSDSTAYVLSINQMRYFDLAKVTAEMERQQREQEKLEQEQQSEAGE